jgi:hypothetical protein
MVDSHPQISRKQSQRSKTTNPAMPRRSELETWFYTKSPDTQLLKFDKNDEKHDLHRKINSSLAQIRKLLEQNRGKLISRNRIASQENRKNTDKFKSISGLLKKKKKKEVNL